MQILRIRIPNTAVFCIPWINFLSSACVGERKPGVRGYRRVPRAEHLCPDLLQHQGRIQVLLCSGIRRGIQVGV